MMGQKEVTDAYSELAEKMVDEQIRSRGIRDECILKVLKKLPRHLFIGTADLKAAYGDHPMGIGGAQTISQPYIVAYMTELLELKGNERILEIGTGSGYQTAVLASLGKEVYTLERIPELGKRAANLLGSLGYKNIHYYIGDGSLGWKEKAPFDRIIVTAAVPEIPEPLKMQLNEGGIGIMPVGDWQTYQEMTKITKKGTGFNITKDIGCRFVPLIGQYGF